MLIIFCDTISPRLEYVFKLLFRDILGVDVGFTTVKEDYINSSFPKINYSKNRITKEELFFYCDDFLFENKIRKFVPEVIMFDGYPVIFPHKNTDSAFPFDPFAMSFYFVSRYEEYLLEDRKDAHGRVKAEACLAFKNSFHHRPVVNIIAGEVKLLIEKKYPAFKFPEKEYKFIPTYDIDMAFAHLGKGLIRSVGGFGKLVLRFKLKEIFERILTLAGIISDPFNNFDQLIEQQKKYNLKSLFFVNLGDYGTYDKNISYKKKRLRKLLKKLDQSAEIGTHPSYKSNEHPEKVKIEKERLEGILNSKVTKSRQHFLLLSFPETYNNLINSGITDDYSMGYASQMGFRAGICNSYNFYDLAGEKETSLRIHPFAFMDTMLEEYLKLNSAQIVEYVKPLIEETKKYNGELIAIWHNYALSNNKEKLRVYREIIKLAKA
ncbi:MAG: polysaccharide deacetylase family protein [Bacteroidales bacterium]|nr:polysaccharide deacetylase family protein [Bacteroidales bacterium]